MKGISRRARTCAVVAATGVAVLAGSTTASAQRPASTGDGIPTGQMSTQMFNYGTYLNNGGNTGAANPVTGVSAACLTSTSVTCRLERLEGLFAFFQRKGVTNIELFGHSGLPGPDATSRACSPTARCWTSTACTLPAGTAPSTTVNAGLARRGSPRPRSSARTTSAPAASPPRASAATRTRWPPRRTSTRSARTRSRPASAPSTSTTTPASSTRKYVDNGVLKSAWQIIMDRTDARYVQAEVDVFWSSDAFGDVTGTQTAALMNANPTRVKMLHIKDGINIVRRRQPDQQPHRLAAPDRHRRARLPADLRGRRWARPSTTTTSRTAARSPTPTRASRTSRASAPRSSARSSASRRRSRPVAGNRRPPRTPSRSSSRTRATRR